MFATPPEWQHEMDRMGFDPTHHDIVSVLHFMENIEAAENTTVSNRTGTRGLLAMFSAFTHGFGRRNTNP